MNNNGKSSYSTCLLALSVVFICTRYICASIMVAGALGDKGTFNMALESLGPFLPAMSMICLLGSVAVSAADVFFALRKRKK